MKTMSEDAELLRRYAEEGSEPAFAELVRRHLNLVYFAALRQVGGDAHRAKDVAQAVFTDLARKASALSRHAVLTGWLYTSTHYAAAKAVRAEQRRQTHEQEARTMNEILQSSAPETDWDRLRPVLDDVMLQLNEADREAVLLRFFEGRPFADVGAKLRLSEDAARMRVERALDKMQGLLAQRGVTSTTVAFGLALTNQAAVAAPAGLAATVTGAALAGAAATGGITAGILQFMGMTKMNVGIIGVLAVAGGAGLLVQSHRNTRLAAELAGLQWETREAGPLQAENERLAKEVAEIERLRRDDAGLARLQSEADSLRQHPPAAVSAAGQARAPGGSTGPVYESRNVEVQPKANFQAVPVYPVELRTAGVAGQAVIGFVVGRDGNVHDAKVESYTHQGFAASALEAVQKWRFDPGQVGGQPVNTRISVPMVYSISNDDDKSKPRAPAPLNWF